MNFEVIRKGRFCNMPEWAACDESRSYKIIYL